MKAINTPVIAQRLSLLLFGLGSSLSAAPGDIQWSFAADGAIYGSPAVDTEGNIYFGAQVSADAALLDDNSLYCLAPNGTLKWKFTGADDWIDSSVALGPDGTVYFGSWDGRLYALNGDTGAEKWNFATAGLIIASPVLGADGTIYVGSHDGLFYALNPDGTLKWAHIADGAIEGSAVLDDAGNIYFATLAGTVFSLTSAGDVRWTFALSTIATNAATEHGAYAGLALDGEGRIYVGSRNHYLVVLESDGQLAWTYQTTDYVDATPVIGENGRVYMTSRDGYLYALDRAGFLEWELLVGDVFYASPALDANGTIYIASYAGNGETVVQAVDPNGVVQWAQILPGYNDASIAVAASGQLLVGMHNHSLYALEAKAALANTAWPKFGYDPQQTHTVQWGPPVGDANVLEVFPMAEVSVSEWYYVDWIGMGWFRADAFPWVNHLQHGWWWCGHTRSGSYWIYDMGLGWIYIAPSMPNLIYSHARGTWLLHSPGSSVYSQNGRWFFDYKVGAWVNENRDL